MVLLIFETVVYRPPVADTTTTENLFGRWRGMIQSVLIAGIMAVAVLTVVSCCCIPCARGLLNRLITTAVGATEAPSAIQAYIGIRYDPMKVNDTSPEGPDPIQL